MPKKLTLTGRVQGVGCRQYCKSYAQDLGIRGSASNRADGSVELLLDTDDDAVLESFTDALLSNPRNFLFWGRIANIKNEDYEGRFKGDYVF
jgi:acylphosphatase